MLIFFTLILIFVALLFIRQKWATAYKNKMLGNFAWIVILTFLIAIIVNAGGGKEGAFYGQLVELAACEILISPAVIIRAIVRKIKAKNEREMEEIKKNGYQPDIPKTAAGRKKIVAKFNKKYDLSLTDEEIERIVNGSFGSTEWAWEIDRMNRDYIWKNEWYNGKNGWLRAYLKAFYVQNVSSDFAYQKEVCLNNFDEIFSSMNISSFYSVSDCVKAINNRFMTNFDDMTFMIAYRFLEENGKKYELPSGKVVEAPAELKELDTIKQGLEQTGKQG